MDAARTRGDNGTPGSARTKRCAIRWRRDALRVDLVDGRLLIFAERPVLAVGDDADDFSGISGVLGAWQVHAAPDGIEAGQVATRELLVDHDDDRRAGPVVNPEHTSLHQADAEGLEVARADEVVFELGTDRSIASLDCQVRPRAHAGTNRQRRAMRIADAARPPATPAAARWPARARRARAASS